MVTSTDKTVATPSDIQSAVAERAELPRTLAGGTRSMRAAGSKYLPKMQAETTDAYNLRLNQSTLFNAFSKTVEDMTGKVFSKPIVLKDNVPAQIKTFAEDIDRAGRHINVFARDVFRAAMVPGISFILVDMPPQVTREDGRPATVADERAAGIRPYLVHIPLERLLGWKSETIEGVEALTQVRILEYVSEPDGEFHEVEIEQIRVIEPGTWRTFRKAVSGDKSGEWVENADGKSSLNKVTLVPVYTNRTGFMTGTPPLEKLAEVNVAHWQSASDQRHILHFARVPVVYAMGFGADAEIVIGPNTMIRSDDPKSKIGILEHTGAAIKAGRDDIKDLEFQMQAMGLQLLVPNPGQSATGEIRDDSKENSPLAMMAMSLGDAIEQVLGFMAEYTGLGADAGGEVEVNTDFGIKAGALVDVPNIINAQSSGLISRDTAWTELQRRGFLSESFDPEVEAARVAAEAPELDSNDPLDMGE